jgi:hypothetical protein
MLIEPKSITPTFDHLMGGGLASGDLTVLSDFHFNRGLFIWLPRPPLFLGLRDLLLFTTIFLSDVMGV